MKSILTLQHAVLLFVLVLITSAGCDITDNATTNPKTTTNPLSSIPSSPSCENLVFGADNLPLRCANGTYFLEGTSLLLSQNKTLTVNGNLVVAHPDSVIIFDGVDSTLTITGTFTLLAPLNIHLELPDYVSERLLINFGKMDSSLIATPTPEPTKAKSNNILKQQDSAVDKPWADANFTITLDAPSCATFTKQRVLYGENSLRVSWSGRKCDKSGTDMTLLVAICAASGIVLLVAIAVPVQQWSLMVFLLAAEFRATYRSVRNTIRPAFTYQSVPLSSPLSSPSTSPLVSPVASSVAVIEV